MSSTAREAVERGLDVLILEDACAAAEPDLHAAAIKGFQMEGGIFGAVARSADIWGVVERWASEHYGSGYRRKDLTKTMSLEQQYDSVLKW